MKKYLYLLTLFTAILVLGACNSDAEDQGDTEQSPENSKVFNEEDITQAEEVVVFLNERMDELEEKVNKNIQNEEIAIEDEASFNTQVQKLADEIVFKKLAEEFDGVIAFKGAAGENENIYFNKTSSEPCSLGHCEYDGIETMQVDVNASGTEEYNSPHFSMTELIFEEAKYSYDSEEEEQSSEIHFVKSKEDILVLSQHPALDIQSINLKEIDKEYDEIQSSVPESEVETEQEAYRNDMEETLAHYPELQ
ncbi:hypothetical protein NM897_16880 (plasmid) [Planococcus maritimus]|uniref:hypothetical protein n=1 Tax=Planococcus maritimus TaxID=192421 RepID=UPI003138EB0E